MKFIIVEFHYKKVRKVFALMSKETRCITSLFDVQKPQIWNKRSACRSWRAAPGLAAPLTTRRSERSAPDPARQASALSLVWIGFHSPSFLLNPPGALLCLQQFLNQFHFLLILYLFFKNRKSHWNQKSLLKESQNTGIPPLCPGRMGDRNCQMSLPPLFYCVEPSCC